MRRSPRQQGNPEPRPSGTTRAVQHGPGRRAGIGPNVGFGRELQNRMDARISKLMAQRYRPTNTLTGSSSASRIMAIRLVIERTSSPCPSAELILNSVAVNTSCRSGSEWRPMAAVTLVEDLLGHRTGNANAMARPTSGPYLTIGQHRENSPRCTVGQSDPLSLLRVRSRLVGRRAAEINQILDFHGDHAASSRFLAIQSMRLPSN